VQKNAPPSKSVPAPQDLVHYRLQPPRSGLHEQSDARERRSRADSQWTINRRRPVIGDVIGHGSTVITAGTLSDTRSRDTIMVWRTNHV
jgi:hypothetical protein